MPPKVETLPPSHSRDLIMRVIEGQLAMGRPSPSVRELLRLTGITGIHEIQHHTEMLERFGYLTKVSGKKYNQRHWMLTKKRYFE